MSIPKLSISKAPKEIAKELIIRTTKEKNNEKVVNQPMQAHPRPKNKQGRRRILASYRWYSLSIFFMRIAIEELKIDIATKIMMNIIKESRHIPNGIEIHKALIMKKILSQTLSRKLVIQL